MAVDTNRYRQRAADAERRLSFQVGSAADLSSAVGAIDEEMRRRREEAEKAKRLAAKDAAEADATRYQRGRDAAADARQAKIDEERAADRAAMTSERTARQKRMDDEAAREAADAKRKDVVTNARAVIDWSTPRATIERLAADANMTPEALLEAVAGIDEEVAGKKAKEAAEMDVEKARAEKERALAKRAGRAPAGPRPMTPAQQEEADLRRRKLRAEVEALERAGKGGAGPGGKPVKPALTPTEVEGVVELQGARSLLDQLEQMKAGKNIDTGPIANAIDWFRSKAGVGDPKRVEFKALVGTQIAEYIKSISGATVSEPERAALLENVPTASDNDEAFMAKLATVKRLIDNKLAAKQRAFAATGRDTKIFNQSSGDDEFDSLSD